MAIIYVNGQPIEVDETIQPNQGQDECATNPDIEQENPGQAGDPVYAEYNFDDTVFLSPIENVNFDQHNLERSREINLLDDYNYYRNYNFTISQEDMQDS